MHKFPKYSGVLLAAFLLTVCMNVSTQAEDDIHQHRRVQTRSILYGVHSEQLYETMLRLNTLISYSQHSALPLDHEKNEFLQQLIETTDEVVKSAQSLKEIDPADKLGTEQTSTFISLADQLHTEALNIKINTKNMNIEELNQAFDKLNQTCNTCHKLFRGL